MTLRDFDRRLGIVATNTPDWQVEQLQLGCDVEESYVSPFSRRLSDGTVRPLTNVEMSALVVYLHHREEGGRSHDGRRMAEDAC